MGDPLVSVIVPVRDGERFLAEALQDVVDQTYSRCELIVVDDGSTDRSAEIARSFEGVRVIGQPPSGIATATNRGIEAAQGELIAFQDSDDRWEPDKLTKQVELLRREPYACWVITRLSFFLEPGHSIPTGFRPHLLEGDHVTYGPTTLLARRSVFDTIGMFDKDYGTATDVEWFARLKDSELKGAVLQETMVRKRVHNSNTSYFAARDFNRELLRVLRDSLARQRT